MAEKSLFFNSFADESKATELNPNGYDRPFNADDISDWLSVCYETGVIKTDVNLGEPQGLKVVAAGGLNVNVKVGKAAIKGKAYINTSLKSLTVETAGTSARYDLIVLRYNNEQNTNASSRKITVEYKKGTSSLPTVNSLTRNNNVYELLLAYLYIGANSNSIGAIYDKRGDSELCPWFTAVKGYENYYDAIIQKHERVVTMASAGVTAITDLPSNLYNEKYSLIEVYTNGIKEPTSAYNVSLSGGYIVITFTTQKSAGAKITVILDNFLDGEGMSTALEQYTTLLESVTKLNVAGEYNYICNGVNDNVLIGDIVRAYLAAGTDYGSMKLNIIGNIGMSAPAYGSGTSSNPYAWFNFNATSNRLAIVDFTRAGQINPTINDGSYTRIFHADTGMHIIGANVVASNTTTSTNIRIVGTASGVVKFENCRFYITGYQDCLIAIRGTFINCRGSVANVINNSYCFLPVTSGVVKVIGGEYYAYTGDSTKQSAIVGQSGADAVTILYGVSAPTAARGGYYQTNSILQWVGGGILSCTDLISELPMVVVSGISNIRGTIAKSKNNVW